MLDQTTTLPKIGRNQFRCFHCRLVFAQKDGDWFDWNHKQIHLCRKCEKVKAKSPETIAAG
jgi:hypothetical protein